MIPAQVRKMMMVPGVYLVSGPADLDYAVVHVNQRGVIEQMKFDGELRPDRWHPDVIIRGPLRLDAPPMETES